ncbi:Asp-tRNA(Asn)/Glu-tRNA(Gln) amidotransferase A subunit family amidase [Bradyrhizobium sp. F1.13.1]
MRPTSGAPRGGELGLLHGVPITIKENVDYQGRPNFNGVPANKDLIAPSDSPVVRNLKKAGAIVIGFTNTPEFSFRGFTDNPLHGLTLNPWDPDITCGGSSGGAGSAVAAGIGTIAHGNDIGGSLRWPAHCNGVATIKPTQGRIPAFNASATAERPMLAHLMSAQGPLARHVADVRLALEVMSQRDPRDPWWVPAPLVGPKPKGPIKVALARIPEDMDVDPHVAAALRQAADHLERSGYRVSEVDVPDIDGVWQTWCDIITNETMVMQEAGMLKVTSEDFHKAWGGMKAKANVLDLKAWMQATAARNGHIRAWQLFFEEYPVVLAPTTVKPTPSPREDTISPERGARDFLGRDPLHLRDQRAGPARRCGAGDTARWQADRGTAHCRALSRGPRARCGGRDREAGRRARSSAMGTDGLIGQRSLFPSPLVGLLRNPSIVIL